MKYKLNYMCLKRGVSLILGHGVDIGVCANLELVDKFCYLGDMLSVEGDADEWMDVTSGTGSPG